MKKFFTFLVLLATMTGLHAQITVTATTGSGSFTSLTKAGGVFAGINAGTITGVITVTVTADVTDEDGATSLSASGVSTSSYTTIKIVPSGARIVSGVSAGTGAPLINLSGADNVTIDGLNAGGNNLTISNTSVSPLANTCTIRFVGDATSNTITNCTILGSSTGATTANTGTIFFHTALTTGNDNNTISNCKIGPAGTNLPSKAIYGNGTTTTATTANSGNSITNCEIYDYFLATGSNGGIYLSLGNTAFTLSNNKLYQTATRTSTAGLTHYGIYVSSSTFGDGFSITGNTIGYNNAAGTGTYTLAGANANLINGIYLSPPQYLA